MPALLTAIIVVCATSTDVQVGNTCIAKVYHGVYAEPSECYKTAYKEAMQWESNVVLNVPNTSSTKSHAECAPAAQDASTDIVLPIFLKNVMRSTSQSITHYDFIDGKAVERKAVKAKSTVQGRRT